jgi:cyclic pyranopterin phosphate synthase
MKNYAEWKINSCFNPFNTFKVLKHLDYWKKININQKVGHVPPPVGVTIDPVNACNFKCKGCNASRVTGSKAYMESHWIDDLPLILKMWGVKTVTIAGGGEPCLHPNLADLILGLHQSGLPTGLITNGSLLRNMGEHIYSKLTWMGVSVDAGTNKTYMKIKGISNRNMFSKVIESIESLANSNMDITFKYLIHPENICDIEEAIKLAKVIGCRRIHIRPVGRAWYEDKAPVFTEKMIDEAYGAISKARDKYEDENFFVFGVTHKFNNHWQAENNFKKCYATFMYMVIEPDGRISTCCDNRGNKELVLADKLKHPAQILGMWGSEEHYELFNRVNVKKCPRCTFSLHNQAYENCILQDKICADFI